MDTEKINYDAEKKAIDNYIKIGKAQKRTILSIMQKFAESTYPIDVNSVGKIRSFLENLKLSVDLCNQNIESLNNLLKDIENTLEPASSNNSTSSSTNTLELKEITVQEPVQAYTLEHVENTLLISEKKDYVVLPYKISELNIEFDNNKDKYSSIDDIIKDKYMLPLIQFKNAPISRFREAYKLIRHKEKGSIKEAFDLGFELMFNYNLHPAIIPACKNLDELDIYLDYLQDCQTKKFDIFNIVFEFPPVIVKSKKNKNKH